MRLLFSELMYIVSCGTLNSTHSLQLTICISLINLRPFAFVSVKYLTTKRKSGNFNQYIHTVSSYSSTCSKKLLLF